ncbi:hypothetical protein M422DRAFT_247959 [Sphaerobolus stellatus SS14]|nr:hypothetical protein M422DRAFT_247959 [Sphaerobolus stellatus SS14]
MRYTRTLRFHNDLQKSATLILTFDKLEEGAFKDYSPVVWKIVYFPSGKHSSSQVMYRNQLAFTTPQVEHDKVTTAGDFTPIELGQRTTIVEEDHAHKFTTPEDGSGTSLIVAENKTTKKIDIGVGFVLSEDNAITALVFRGVGPSNNVSAQFTPIARAYVATEYRQDDILKGPMKSTLLWEQNLEQLEEDTKLLLKDNPDGTYTLSQVPSS